MPDATRFRSVLFGSADPPAGLDETAEPDYFHDLNLDQIVAGVNRRRSEYELTPFFRYALHDLELVEFRQRVFRDLDAEAPRKVAEQFAVGMARTRECSELVGKVHYALAKQRWFLEAVLAYCDAVAGLAEQLAAVDLASEGLQAVREDVSVYAASPSFQDLGRQARQLHDGLDEVRYNILIRGNKITVGPFDEEADYGVRVLETFERFQQTEARDYRKKITVHPDMDHIEAAILEMVAKICPDLFTGLAAFCTDHQHFVAAGVARLDRELQFYLGYLAHVRPMRDAGLSICYPTVVTSSKEVDARGTYDLALADKLLTENAPVVVNDFSLTGAERILVVSGPNQGGKTTLSRTFGQLHHLAWLGCPVPGDEVRVFLADRIFTHYEREEELDTLAGKLEDELLRVHTILEQATPNSVIIMNEIFTSTTLQDARTLSERILNAITDLDALCVCVSFIDELSRLNQKTVSMVSTVVADDPATRTYKVIRQPADGRAYAMAIAQKHGLTYEQLTGRIGR